MFGRTQVARVGEKWPVTMADRLRHANGRAVADAVAADVHDDMLPTTAYDTASGDLRTNFVRRPAHPS